MINGVLLFEDGSVQQIGELTSGKRIVIAARQLIDQLEHQERLALRKQLTDEELDAIKKLKVEDELQES